MFLPISLPPVGEYLSDKFLEVEFLDQRVCSFGILIGIAEMPSQEAILVYTTNKVLILRAQHIQGEDR